MTTPHNQESSRQPYSIPQYTTSEATDVFNEWVQSKARKGASRLDYLATQNQVGNQIPRQRAEVVRQVIADIDGTRTERGDRRNQAVLANILVTSAIVGLGITGNFLSHSTWQLITFVGFVLIGVIALTMTWRAGRVHASRPDGPRA